MNPNVQRARQLLYFYRMLLNPYITETVALINVHIDILGLNSFKLKLAPFFPLGGFKFRGAFKTQRNFSSAIYFIHMGFPDSSAGKEYTCNAGDSGSIPGSGRSPGREIGYPLQYSWASLVAQSVKNPPAMREIWVWVTGWEDPLGKGMAPPSSILVWKIPMDRGAWWAAVHRGGKYSDTTERLSTAQCTVYMSILLSPVAPLFSHCVHRARLYIWVSRNQYSIVKQFSSN